MDDSTNTLFETVSKQLGKKFIVSIEKRNRAPVRNIAEVSFFGDQCDDGFVEGVRKNV